MEKIEITDNKGINILPQFLQKLWRQDVVRTLAKGTGTAFVIQGLGSGIKYISEILFARWMGSSDYGVYATALTWAKLLAMFCGLGLTISVLRFIPDYTIDKNWSALRGLIRWGRWITVVFSLAVAIIGTVFILFFPSQKIDAAALIIALWLIPFFALGNLHMEILRGNQRIIFALLPMMLLQYLIAIGAAFVIWLISSTLTSLTALYLVMFTMGLVLVMQSWALKFALPQEINQASPSYAMIDWLRVSIPLLFSAGFVLVINQADILLVGLILGPQEAGIYSAATKTANLIVFILMAANTIAAPMIAGFSASNNHKALQKTASTVAKGAFWPSLIVGIGLWVFGDFVLGIFGPEFTKGLWSMRILIFAQLVNASVGSVGYLMSLTGHHNTTTKVYGTSALINVILNIVLIPQLGLIGAAIATSLSIILWNVWFFVLVKKRLAVHSFFLSF